MDCTALQPERGAFDLSLLGKGISKAELNREFNVATENLKPTDERYQQAYIHLIDRLSIVGDNSSVQQRLDSDRDTHGYLFWFKSLVNLQKLNTYIRTSSERSLNVLSETTRESSYNEWNLEVITGAFTTRYNNLNRYPAAFYYISVLADTLDPRTTINPPVESRYETLLIDAIKKYFNKDFDGSFSVIKRLVNMHPGNGRQLLKVFTTILYFRLTEYIETPLEHQIKIGKSGMTTFSPETKLYLKWFYLYHFKKALNRHDQSKRSIDREALGALLDSIIVADNQIPMINGEYVKEVKERPRLSNYRKLTYFFYSISGLLLFFIFYQIIRFFISKKER